MQVKASEAVYIGDNPIEDIKGAGDAGLRTVFVSSQFNSLKDLLESKIKPDFTVNSLEEICEKFRRDYCLMCALHEISGFWKKFYITCR